MPYRRLPKTDTARLKALKTVLENNAIYTVRNRFIDWQTLNRAQPAYDRLLTATEQYRLTLATQVRNGKKIERYQRTALMYVSHFIQVLFMSVERGEIKKQVLPLYGFTADTMTLPKLNTPENLLEWGQKIAEGEQQRKRDREGDVGVFVEQLIQPQIGIHLVPGALKKRCAMENSSLSSAVLYIR